MNHQPVRLSFAARTLDEHTTNVCAEAMQYDTLLLNYQPAGVMINCILPYDAKIGDSISLSATSVTGRGASFAADSHLTKQHLDNGHVELCLKGRGNDGEYVIQLNLLGIYNTVKNSAEFSAQLQNQFKVKQRASKPFLSMPWSKTAKRYAASVLTSFLSIF
ncbi:hypothetical protein [Pseudoalteromonas aurantia]|uniref:PilZ domain-containing protein n=1 Tax=Pseudoalteromonas aurantia 208 TaxID=1314867 RepID=A0ABR9EI98_9GAMM|nr:hypothetical protein [Pseudoalteromonas aurantia]MBE0370740.1 hypothetical protein [Pseudoalteromonas aurantia 208]